MVNNLWKNTEIYCGNEHEEPVKMELQTEGKVLKYECPVCKRNTLSLNQFEKMIDEISKRLTLAEINCEAINLTNYKWTKKLLNFKILEYGDVVRVLVLNKENL